MQLLGGKIEVYIRLNPGDKTQLLPLCLKSHELLRAAKSGTDFMGRPMHEV
jgi:hypothetical protein